MELIFILFIILAPISFLTLLEIIFLKESCEKTLKYLKLLKGIEIFFFLSSNGVIWLIICIIIYFTVLIFDFYKKIINIKEFIISIIYYIIDIVLAILILYKVEDSLSVVLSQ